MKNSADLGGCCPPQPSASVDNTLLDLQNSSVLLSLIQKLLNIWTVSQTKKRWSLPRGGLIGLRLWFTLWKHYLTQSKSNWIKNGGKRKKAFIFSSTFFSGSSNALPAFNMFSKSPIIWANMSAWACWKFPSGARSKENNPMLRPRGRKGLLYENVGNVRRDMWIKPLREN